ncbi:MAG: sulfatase, partial [Candidatus Zixiibacteriota bacterium]
LDRELGHFFERLKRRGLWDSSLIIITADHGEEFLEHLRWGHGQSLYQELIHVPLLLKFPKRADISTQVIENPVNTIDITPTILDFVGRADLATEMQGKSLLPLIRGQGERGNQSIFSEVEELYCQVVVYALLEDTLKLILSRDQEGENKVELYNIVRDPGEKNNLWRESEGALGMKERCENFINHLQAGEPREKSKFDPQTLEKLKAMGYLR